MEDPWIILTEWYWPENKERRAELTPSHMVSDTSQASNSNQTYSGQVFDKATSNVLTYRNLHEEFKAATELTEIYVHTSEARGREAKHASDYEAPNECFVDIDVTSVSVNLAFTILLKKLNHELHREK